MRLADELMEVTPYSAPMDRVSPGVLVIQDSFLKEMMQRIRFLRWDLTLRKLNRNGYVIELIVRYSIQKYDVNTIGHFDTSELANECIGPLLQKAKEYAKFEFNQPV